MRNKEFKTVAVMAAIMVIYIFALTLGVEKWKKDQQSILVVPVKGISNPDNRIFYPMIAYMPNCGMEDCARLYTFIEQYIRWTIEESFDDYEKQTTNDQFKLDYLKTKLKTAIYASRGKERTRNSEKLINSSNRYYELKQKNLQWHFNLDAIESVLPGPRSGMIYVSVIGEYSLTYDKRYVQTPDEKAIGYKRIHFLIEQGVPEKDLQDNFTNGYGLYVLDSWQEPISYSVQDDLFKRVMASGFNIDMNPSMKAKNDSITKINEKRK